MRKVLLVDFGATRMKFGIWDGKTFRVLASEPSPTPCQNDGDLYEVSPMKYWHILEKICAETIPTDIVICSEMHGFIIESDTYSNYISWQDHRGADWIATLQEYQDEFKEKTGMIFKPGLPITNLLAMHINGLVGVYTLVDWLLLVGKSPKPYKINQTLALGTGIHGVANPKYYSKITANSYEKLGVITINDRQVNVYGGFGDLQAAIYGAGFPKKAEFIINMGTGSQVLTTYDMPEWEWRYGIDQHGIEQRKYSAVTHIPCGRALNAFTYLIPEFFGALQNMSVSDVLNSTLTIDLSVFDSAYKHTSLNGCISNITESNLTMHNLCASLIKNWLWQYAQLILSVPDKKSTDKVLVSGKMGQYALIREVLSIMTGLEVIPPDESEEATLVGLRKIAEILTLELAS